MIKAILFDLDGCLIDVDLTKFIPAYLKLLSDSVAHLIQPRKFISKMLKASEVVNNNNGPMTNEQLYAETFFPIEGYSREEIEPYFNSFYDNDFNKLKRYTNKKPEAREVVKTLFEKNYKIVIATTPVIPLSAIQQRLDWAGVGDFKYDLITSYENSYASKPNLLYFQHIFEFLQLTPEECIMIGDEHKDLIVRKLGTPTFFINSQNSNLNSKTPEPTYSGNLSDILDVLKI